MKYCTRCVMPDSRPTTRLDAAGVCNACLTHAQKNTIDWPGRERAFRDVVRRARERSSNYDCVIPVSGGKDSTWQVVRCLEYGLTPLAVTWKAPSRTAIGWRNLTNLIGLGVDHIDYQVSPRTERKFLYQALVRYGATAIPMHMAMFNIPLSIAVRFRIPLVVWGENSAFEYGSVEDAHQDCLAHGFEPCAEPKIGFYAYADIDDDFISIHHHLKWYKFGYTRLFDNLSLEIRNDRMTRQQAIAIIRDRGDQTPHDDIEKFCGFIGITRSHFVDVIERFRNPRIWTWRGDRWMIDGFLVPDWEWT